MWSFVVGFLAGFFANGVFGALSRLLPDGLVRYVVRIGSPYVERDLGGGYWLVPVTITRPRWMKALAEPLREDLVIEVSQDGETWIESKWLEGDVNITRLLADRSTTVPGIVLTQLGHHVSWSLADKAGGSGSNYGRAGDLRVRVLRRLDGQEAAKGAFKASKDGNGQLHLDSE